MQQIQVFAIVTEFVFMTRHLEEYLRLWFISFYKRRIMSMLKLLFFIGLFFAFEIPAVTWPGTSSVIKKDPMIELQIKNILNSMSIEEKVAQMIQAEIKFITPDDLKQYPLGSILNGGGSFPNDNKLSKISDWVNLADSFYNASINSGKNIPIIWGTDAVHGHNNVIGATIFPHNIGLGATNNPKLIEKIGEATALEVLATGIDWVFAPTVAVVRNDRWGRTYEGYSEDPGIVKKYAESMINGLQGKSHNILNQNHLIATAKHFIGDGGTQDGTDQGDNTSNEDELISIHAQGYITAINAGAQTVMASFNSWKGMKLHGHKYLLTDVLKGKISFDGFVVGDWNGHGQVPGCQNDSCPQAINAGVDMLMAPQDWKSLFNNTVRQIKNGEIELSRIDDAVTRILRVKIRYGLFDLGKPSKRKHAGDEKMVGAQYHRDVANQAVRESLVLLKNTNNILPLNANSNVLVAGSGADNIGKQSGGWSITWQGTGNTNSDFPGGSSIYSGIENAIKRGGGKVNLSLTGEYTSRPDFAIVVFGEEPYAEGQGDLLNLFYGIKYSNDIELLKKIKSQGIPVVSIFITGRPLWINPELNASDAFVVAWLPGSEGKGVSDVLIRKNNGKVNFDFKGKLSFSWPNHALQTDLNLGDKNYKPLFPYGFGLNYSTRCNLGDNLSENPFPQGDEPGSSDKIDIFIGRPVSPFKTYVSDSGNSKKEIVAGIGESANLVVKSMAVDKETQEDARQITFNGTETGSYFFESDKQVNLSHYSDTNGALSFYLRRDSSTSGPLMLEMNQASLDITHLVGQLKPKEWTKLTVPLSCFTSRGLDLRSLKRSFAIVTNGSATISLANIKVDAKSISTICP
jgi:beta-glucosidase